jgi:hypothetical protein
LIYDLSNLYFINVEDVKRFFNFIYSYDKNKYLEIRILPVVNIVSKDKQKEATTKVWNVLNNLNIENKKKNQFFIQTIDELLYILSELKEVYKIVKVCYGVNPRYKIKNKLSGGYANLIDVEYIYFDIDKKDHSNLQDIEIIMIDNYVKTLTNYLIKYELKYPTIINSGAGRHIIYKIPKQKITECKKLWIKEFGKSIKSKFENDNFEIDAIFDFTRILSLPETINPKRQKWVKTEKISNLENKFKIKSKKIIKHVEYINENLPEVENSIEWKILTNPNCPIGDTTNTIVFAIKLLLKNKGIKDYYKYEQIVNKVWNTNINLNPDQGTQNKTYNANIIKNWCEKHKEFCKDYNIL